MKTHAEHETTVAIGRTQGFLLCLDCRVIVEDLALCGKPTKRGAACRWAVMAGSETAEHPHTAMAAKEQQPRPKHVRLDPRPTMFISTAESRWLDGLVRTKGRIEGRSIALDGLKQGQAELIVGRYGGVAEGGAHPDWTWRCEGQQAERIIAAIGTDGRGE